MLLRALIVLLVVVNLGVADDGALRLELEDGSELKLHSGEVSVRDAFCLTMEER